MTYALAMTELVGEEIEPLPSRETLALVNFANITAVNLALALNAGNFGPAMAAATASQGISVVQ